MLAAVPDPPPYKLVGTDGNVFSIIGRARHALQIAGSNADHR